MLFGTAVVAPFAMPGAETGAEALAFEARINQEFVPNEFPEDDMIYPDVESVELPDPAEIERQRIAAEEAAKAKEAEEAAKKSSAEAPRYTGGGSPAEWMAAAGIAESDWGYVDYIVRHESTWNPNAINANGGYCGLVQIAPMHGVANCTDPVVNLSWGNSYAQSRYGGWAAAYNHGVLPGGGWGGW